MAYDENIRIIAEELERVKNRPTGDKLPDVESTDEGKVLTVNSLGKWAAENPTSPYDLDYSTTEKDTGKKWIDGNAIYRKVIELSEALVLPSNTWTATDINISGASTMLKCSAIDSNGTLFDFLAVNSLQPIQLLQTRSSDITVNIIILEYTKTTQSKKKGAK